MFYIIKCTWTKINQQLGLQHRLLVREDPSTSSPSHPDKPADRLLANFVCKFLDDSEGLSGTCNITQTVQEQILVLVQVWLIASHNTFSTYVLEKAIYFSFSSYIMLGKIKTLA